MDTTSILTPTEVIDRARAARDLAQAAAVEELQLALAWAHLHPCPAGETAAGWGEADLHGEQIVPLAGPGAPLVGEFAPADLAAALDITHDAARDLLGDALELAHRLPRLWELVVSGVVVVWRARLISRETHDLPSEAAAFADQLISATPGKLGLVNARKLVDEARLFFDPDRAKADEDEALARRRVWLRKGRAPATTDVSMTLDTPDADVFDQTVGRIALELRELGDADDLDVRRAKAVGVLADPQHALDLMSGREAGPSAGSGALDLFVHLTPEDLAETDGSGMAVIEKLGVATTRLLTKWLARHCAAVGKVVVRPVLDLGRDWAVDAHDPPGAMREQVIQSEATCVFPGCHRDSRGCDLDHINEYIPMDEGGPPGQTNPDKLRPDSRESGWDPGILRLSG